MRRRQFITLLGGAAAWPLATRAQQPNQMRRIGILMGGLDSGDAAGQAEARAFEDGLRELGWKVGGNIALDYHWPGSELDQVTAVANDIAATRPDLVVSRATPATMAMVKKGLPVVFVLVTDPVGSGLVQNLRQPGGNITGFSIFEFSVSGKWLELLKEIAPTVTGVSLLFNPATAPFAEGYLPPVQAAAQTLGVTVIPVPCGNPTDIEAAFAARARAGGGIIIMSDTFLTEHRNLIIELAARFRLPAIYANRVFVSSGGLMSYAADFPDIFRRCATYVDKILHGVRPGELPVQQPTKFILSVNLKAARAIGLTVPQTLLAIADEVIE